MRLVVVGGTGFIGQHLCRACGNENIQVTVLARRPEHARAVLGAGIEVVEWDPARMPPPAGTLEHCDAVVNLAGHSVAHRWTRNVRRLIHDSRARATERLVGRIGELDSPPRVLLNASATGYYGDRGDDVLTERSAAGTGFIASLCCDWEASAEAATRLGVRVVLLRMGPVIGRKSKLVRRLLPSFRWGLGATMGSGRQWMPWVHVADAIGLILHALRTPAIDGPLNVAAPNPATNAEFTRAFARALRRHARLRVPRWMLRLALGEMASMMLASQRVAPETALRTGYAFRFPDLADCLEDVLSKQ